MGVERLRRHAAAGVPGRTRIRAVPRGIRTGVGTHRRQRASRGAAAALRFDGCRAAAGARRVPRLRAQHARATRCTSGSSCWRPLCATWCVPRGHHRHSIGYCFAAAFVADLQDPNAPPEVPPICPMTAARSLMREWRFAFWPPTSCCAVCVAAAASRHHAAKGEKFLVLARKTLHEQCMIAICSDVMA